MSETMAHVQRLLHDVEPFKRRYEEIDKEIEAVEATIHDKRLERDMLKRMIRVVEPDFEKREYDASGNRKPKGSRNGSTAHKYSPERIATATAWFQEHAEELNTLSKDGFYASGITEMPGVPVKAQSGLSAILVQLHDMGIVRLTKRGGMGGRKYYKVVV